MGLSKKNVAHVHEYLMQNTVIEYSVCFFVVLCNVETNNRINNRKKNMGL